jgi:hypothetical protein
MDPPFLAVSSLSLRVPLRANISIMMSLDKVQGFLVWWRVLADRWRAPGLMPDRHLGRPPRGVRLAGNFARHVLFGLCAIGNALAAASIVARPRELGRPAGLVVGIGQMGGGLSFAYTIWVQYVILRIGWRLTFLVLAGVLVAVLFPLYLLSFYYRPRDKGLTPYGAADVARASEGDTTQARGAMPAACEWPLANILRSSQLWLLVGRMPSTGVWRTTSSWPIR